MTATANQRAEKQQKRPNVASKDYKGQISLRFLLKKLFFFCRFQEISLYLHQVCISGEEIQAGTVAGNKP